jgi:hypothetical protein
MTTINQYNYFINSKNRSSGSSQNFQILLKDLLVLKKTTSNFYVSIKTAEIPYSFFSLTNDFNTLSITLDNTNYTLTIPEGNYNAISLNNVFNNLIQPYVLHGTFSIEYDRSTGKNTILISNYDLTSFNLKIKWDLNLELGRFFGYTLQTEITATVGITYTNNISDIYADCSQIQCLYIRSISFSQIGNYEILYTDWVQSSILQKIIVTTPPNSIIFYQNELFNNVKINNKSISYFDFFINSNKSSREIDFNGLDYSFRLSIDEIDTIVDIPNIVSKLPEKEISEKLYDQIMSS